MDIKSDLGYKSQLTIIGFGNTLREDDGIGAYVVKLLKQEFEKNNYIKVKSLSEYESVYTYNQYQIILKTLHQIDISEAENLSESDYIFFIDVQHGKYEEDVYIEQILPKRIELGFTTHTFSLSNLLYIIQTLYKKNPIIYLFAIKGSSFGFDDKISHLGVFRSKKAVKKILEFLTYF